MFPDEIETDRLRLERLCHENVAARELYECFARGYGEDVDEVFEHVPQTPYRTVMDAHEQIEDAEARWDDRDGAEYVIRPRDGEERAGELAGLTELTCQWEHRTGKFGLILRKQFWGRGYSSERAKALMELAFERLDLELVTAGHNEGNERSKRAIEKYVETHGGQYDGVLRNWVPMDDEVADLYRYTVTNEQYETAVRE